VARIPSAVFSAATIDAKPTLLLSDQFTKTRRVPLDKSEGVVKTQNSLAVF
jgi:hypothetical protein